MKCGKCGQEMTRLWSEDEQEFYFECQNKLENGSICWNIE